MLYKTAYVKKANLNLGELHKLHDFEYFNPVFECETETGEQFTAKLRLHISQDLKDLLIADPNEYADAGWAINSVNSKVIFRKTNYTDEVPEELILDKEQLGDVKLFKIDYDSLMEALLNGYNFEKEKEKFLQQGNVTSEIAFTCHDPNIIGGGNVILFRLINWLSDLGINVTVYSCGTPPTWKRVNANFKCFKTYKEMFDAVDEQIIIVYSMWHIEPMLQSDTTNKLIYHIRQIYEPYHYGKDYDSMISAKPPIQLLETLPIGVITISPHLQEYYKKYHGLDSLLITNGIDPKVFYPEKKKGVDKKDIKIVSVGNPNHFVKGSKELYKVLSFLTKKRTDINITWEICTGSKGNIDYENIPNNLVIKQLVGLSQTEVRDAYAAADIFVNPSLYEGFGLPPLEAMLTGTPVVQADNLGLDFIVDGKEDCLLVPVNEVEKMSDAIEKLINDEKEYYRIAEGGFNKAMQYTSRHQFKLFITAFEEILNTKFNNEKVSAVQEQFGYQIDKPISLKQTLEEENKYNPLVSVIIPSYNQAEYLKEALDSLIEQTYSNWEAVVINDGSKDNTKEVMEEYAKKDSRIRPFSKENGGITSALNAGLERAKGEFFCWLSSDDLFYPDKIELQVNAFKNLDESYALVYGSFDILNESETTKTLQKQPFARQVIKGCEFPEAFKFDFIDGCTIMIRMNVMREVKGFNSGIVHSQDMELWVRLASRGYRFHLLNNKLTIRRVHVAQSSTTNMIHCRYDAAWMINFYIVNYHLMEVYRYIDFNSEDGIKDFVQHFVTRTLETEANVNHPLLMEKFWNWFVEGIKVLPVVTQNILLRQIQIAFLKNINATYKTHFYIKKCYEELNKEREFVSREFSYSHVNRDFREGDRSKDKFGEELFNYGCQLLINSDTPLFAQELFFHNTNKLVDTPYKLAHSALRYLTQFNSSHKDIILPYADLKYIPETEAQALELYCNLNFPELSKEMLKSYLFDEESAEVNNDFTQSEIKIANMGEGDFERLSKLCENHDTTIPIFYYWFALALRKKGKSEKALENAWYIINSADSRILLFIAELAAGQKDFEKAYYSLSLIKSDIANNAEIQVNKEKYFREYVKECNIIPTPPKFVTHKQSYQYPEIELLSFKVYPKLNGTFDFEASCKDESGKIFNAKSKGKYEEILNPIVISNHLTGKSYVISPSSIFNKWLSGYNFFDALDKELKKRAVSKTPPSVAISLPYSSVMSGGGLVVLRFANWLKQLGIVVKVYSTDSAPTWFDLQCDFIQNSKRDELYKSIEEQIVLCYSAIEIPHVLKQLNGSKRVYHLAQVIEDFHYHGDSFDSLMKPKGIFEMFHSLPVGRISVSKHITDYLNKRYNQKAYTIENGIDLNNFTLHKRNNFTNEVTISTIGNPHRTLKGVDDVIRAMEIVADKMPDKVLNLIVVSGSKPLTNKILESNRSNFRVNILWDLKQEEINEIYQKSDAYVNGSWYEGFGLPTLEAMATGTPVVQVDNKGLDGIIVDKENCVIAQPNNPNSIATKVVELLTDDGLKDQIIRGGFNTAGKYSLVEHFQKFVDVFEKILIHKFDKRKVTKIQNELAAKEVNQIFKPSLQIINPTLSVIIPVTKGDKNLAKTISSLIDQEYPKWQAVIVYSDIDNSNFDLIRNTVNTEGRFVSKRTSSSNYADMLNEGVNLCEGEWIQIMQPGTHYLPNRISNLINIINVSPGKNILFSEYYLDSESSKKPVLYSENWLENIPDKKYQLIGLLNSEYIFEPAVAFHVSIVKQNGGFDSSCKQNTFYDFLLKAHKKNNSAIALNGTVAGPESRVYKKENYDSFKKLLVGFIEKATIEELFPKSDLTTKDDIIAALDISAMILNNKNSLINRFELTEKFKDKILLWIKSTEKNSGVEKLSDLFRTLPQINMEIIERHFRFFKNDASKLLETNKNKTVEKVTTKKLEPKTVANKLPETSIILVTYNQSKYTFECIDSIKTNTKLDYEIIVVDNNSADDTVSKLKSDKSVTLIQNKENLGFPKAVNMGIKAASGKNILILNNDTIVTKGWLERMIEVADSNDKFGIVGPISNIVSGVQVDKEADYKTKEEMFAYAEKVSKNNQGEFVEFPRVAFLCTLIKREVIDKIGGLDERFTPGNYEDDDFCLRAQLAGYKTVIAKDVFIHHYGSKSFGADGEKKYAQRLKVNEEKFVNKWGADPNEIWLKSAKIKSRNINYPVDKSEFIESFTRTLIHAEENELNLAFAEAEKAIRSYEGSSRKGFENITKEDVYNLAAKLAFQLGNLEKAQEYFKSELENNSNSARACFGLAEVFKSAELYEQAKSMYEWSIKNGNNDHLTISKLSEVNVKLGLPENDNSLVKVGEESPYTIEIAEDLLNKSDLQGAEEVLNILINEQPNSVDILNDFAVLKIMQENYKEAVEYLEKVLKIDPTNEIAIGNLSYIEEALATS